MKQKNGSLKGKWFHSWKDGEIHWQGRVLSANPADGYALVQLFSWIDGSPTEQKMVPLSDMGGWSYYPSALAMRRRYSRYRGESHEAFERNEQVLRFLQ